MPRGEDVLVELQQVMRVVSKKETGGTSTTEAWPVAISGEDVDDHACAGGAELVPQSSDAAGRWLIAITESNRRLTETREKPRIQRVPELLRRTTQSDGSFFKPEVVSLGPYHYHRGQGPLAEMEEHKRAAAARYAGGDGDNVVLRSLHEKVMAVAGKAKGCYGADAFEGISDDEFADMMLLDGCFVLHFIDCVVKGDLSALTTGAHLQGFITRDIFLLENQLPFMVLEALMSLKPVDYDAFICRVAGTTTPIKGRRWRMPPRTEGADVVRSAAEGPAHLLDLLRTRLLEQDTERATQKCTGEANWQRFRSVMELKEAGIKFRKSDTSCLRDIWFRRGRVHGHLHLPQLVVDDLTRPRFLNLIAFEMCPDSKSGYGVTSYVCFLDHLIDHAADVRHLRRKGILLNALGNDEQVADLFNEIATGLSPDPRAYSHAITGINKHYNNKRRVSIVTMLHTHFSSPWTAISFIAAVFLLLMTATQTFFTVFSKFTVSKR